MFGSPIRHSAPQHIVSVTDEAGRLIMKGKADSIMISGDLWTAMPEVTVSFRDVTGVGNRYLCYAPAIAPLAQLVVQIRKVIYNDPATIVLWDDGTKTVVKCHDGDTYSRQVGLLMCIAKKVYGNRGHWYDVLRERGALDD